MRPLSGDTYELRVDCPAGSGCLESLTGSKEAHVEVCAGHTLKVRWVGMATHLLGPHQTLEGISKVPFGLERVNWLGQHLVPFGSET